MLEINLSLPGLNALRVKAREDEAFMREGLKMIQPTSSSKSHPTIPYIIGVLTNMDAQGTKLRAYIKSHIWGITGTAGQKALAEEIESLFVNITETEFDPEKINVVDEETSAATALLLACFEKYQAMFPEQPDERLRHTIEILNDKIKAYQTKAPAEVTEKATEETIEEVKTTSITPLEEELPDQEIEVTETLLEPKEEEEEKATFVIEQFDTLISDFREKVSELQSRSQSIKSKTEKNRYLGAFEDGLMLLVFLEREKEALKTTADVETFKTNVINLLDDFPGDGKFAANRSQPWFRACIAEPFEKLKKAISKIFPEFTQRNNRFFQPSETDATKKLNALRDGAKDIATEETQPENKNQQP
ncbi:MAG: hypothetical protein K0U24_04650 [Gammaproteobacteria bacterium]|nr:hypothetical protein [Gammaproteobacteria bacterium]MCH9763505.1 hypothetical protein [Gammaproteobacteria bacterium]